MRSIHRYVNEKYEVCQGKVEMSALGNNRKLFPCSLVYFVSSLPGVIW
jgi:hypothetical protein